MKKRIAIYPGTFDPVTLGHLDVIRDGLAVFDEIIVGILKNIEKDPRFSEEERKTMIEEAMADLGLTNARVKIFDGLTVELARREGAIAIIRGLRLTTEYEDELNTTFNSRIWGPGITHLLFPPHQEHIHISSKMVRQFLHFKQYSELDKYLPMAVLERIGVMEEKYKAKVLEVCRDLSKNKGSAEFVSGTIIQCYQEPHRVYHVLKHIYDSLIEFEPVKHLLQNPDAVKMEILSHDTVYKFHTRDNEEKSGELAKDLAKLLGLESSFGERVSELIVIATKHHNPPPPPTDFDAQAAADIDLAPLGYSEREFDKNAAKVRKEYRWMPEEKFKTKRIAFLKTLLPPKRPAIYSTQFFRDKYERQARKNIRRAIAQLSK